MKKVIFGSLFALVATIGLVSCDKDEVKPLDSNINSSNQTIQEVSDIELNEDGEKLRQLFASNMVIFMDDTKEMY